MTHAVSIQKAGTIQKIQDDGRDTPATRDTAAASAQQLFLREEKRNKNFDNNLLFFLGDTYCSCTFLTCTTLH